MYATLSPANIPRRNALIDLPLDPKFRAIFFGFFYSNVNGPSSALLPPQFVTIYIGACVCVCAGFFNLAFTKGVAFSPRHEPPRTSDDTLNNTAASTTIVADGVPRFICAGVGLT